MSLRSSGLRSPDARHRPVFCPAPGLAGRPVPFPRRGVRNDRAFHRARGAMCREAHGNRVLRSTRQTQPRKQQYACVPHANGLCGLLHVPGVVTGADAPPFVRAVARTCTWTVRPFCRRLSLKPRAKDQRSRKRLQGSGIVAATASRSAFRRRSPRAPYRDGMADKFSQARGKVKQRRNKVQGFCFLKTRNMRAAFRSVVC